MMIQSILLLVVALASVRAQFPPLVTVSELDLLRYQGRWFEIATSIFSRSVPGYGDGYCVTASYTLFNQTGVASEDVFIRVLNDGRQGSSTGRYTNAVGHAVVSDPSKPGEVTVSFAGDGQPEPPVANYFIMEVNQNALNYEYVLIGSPSRTFLWILSRTPTMATETYEYLVEQAEAQGYNIDSIQFRNTPQDNCWNIY